MNVWPNAVITNKGLALLAKLTQGNTLDVVEGVTGAGWISPDQLINQTEITDTRTPLTFRPVSYPKNGSCAMPVTLTNDGLATGYVAKQVGVFAMDPDEGKILFLIAQSSAADKGTPVPSETEMPGYSADWTFLLEYGQADSVNVTVSPANTVSRAEMEAYCTKENLGLGNVNNTADTDKHVAYAQRAGEADKTKYALTLRLNGGRTEGSDMWTFDGSTSRSINVTPEKIGAAEAVHTHSHITLQTIRALTPVVAKWCSVAYGAGTFVAIDVDGLVAYSTDGIHWTGGASLPEARYWESVAYGGDKFVAVGADGNAAYSTDGVTWTQTALPQSYNCRCVTYGAGKFVALFNVPSSDTGGSGKAAYSTDGITWTGADLPFTSDWVSAVYGAGKFVAVSSAGSAAVYSTDGISWSQGTVPSSGNTMSLPRSVTFGNDKFVAVGYGDGNVLYSEDGITWTVEVLMSVRQWASVAYGNGKFVALAYSGKTDGSGDNVVAYSEDGITWIETTLPVSGYWTSLVYGNGKFVAVSGHNTSAGVDGTNFVACSTDGITWIDAVYALEQDGVDVTELVRSVLGL